MSTFLEALSLLIIGVILVIAFTHFLNGTFGAWSSSKIQTKKA